MLAVAVSGLWAVADPLFAGPDEPAHVIRAHSLDHGQFIGKTATDRILRELGGDNSNVMVRAPEIYRDVGTPCFAFQRDLPADCLHLEGPRRRLTR